MDHTDEAMLEMVENMWEQFFKPRIRSMMAQSLRFYRAKVVSAPSDGTISVQEPFDDVHRLPYVSSAAGLKSGDQCIVLVLGDAVNSIVIGDGTLSNL